MTRTILILLVLTTAAHAQVALTPQWDVRQNQCSPADCAAIKRSQDAPWVDRAVDFKGIGTAYEKAMRRHGWVHGTYGYIKGKP